MHHIREFRVIIPIDLHKKFKMQAAKDSMAMKYIVIRLIKRYIDEAERSQKREVEDHGKTKI